MDADTLKRFGAEVRRVRNAQQLSQERLAERADLDATFIGRVERAETNPSLTTATRIARGLGLTLSQLLT